MSLLKKRVLFLLLAIPTFGYGFSRQPPTQIVQVPVLHPLVVDTQRAVDFSAHLCKAIQDNPKVEPLLAKRIKAVLDGPDSFRKTVVLRCLERHARAYMAEQHYAAGNIEAIDWSKVDWASILGVLIKILVLILPLL